MKSENTNDIMEIIIKILHELMSLDKIQPNFRLKEDLGMESMSYIALLVEIENFFDITIDDTLLELKANVKLQELVENVKKIIEKNEIITVNKKQ